MPRQEKFTMTSQHAVPCAQASSQCASCPVTCQCVIGPGEGYMHVHVLVLMWVLLMPLQ
jgi:hypothetical protein